MSIKSIVRIALGIIAIGLAYFIFEGIMKPQRFETFRSRREAEVVNRLRDIRTAQIAFRNINGRFCGTLDSLILFLEHGQMPTVRKTGEIPDTLTEAQALRLGIIGRDTIFTNAHSVLFPDRVDDRAEHLATLKFIPFTRRTREFSIQAGMIERSNVFVPVVEVSAHITEYMLNEEGEVIPEFRQFIRNAIKRAEDIDRFPGLRFGSMTDPHTEGNWE